MKKYTLFWYLYRSFSLSLFALFLSFSSISTALDMGNVEGRIRTLENKRDKDTAEIDSLEREVKRLKRTLQSDAKQVDTRLKAVDKKVSQTKKTTHKRIESVQKLVELDKRRITMNGFLTAGWATTDDDVQIADTKFENDGTPRPDSKVGLQTSFWLTEQASATVQLLALGNQRFDIDAGWGYLSYQLTDDLSVRGGRFKIPIYYLSDSQDVGFSYPSLRPPIEFYADKHDTWEAIELLYKIETGMYIHSFQAGWGSFAYPDYDLSLSSNVMISSLEGTDAYSLNYTVSRGPLNLRLGYSQFTIETGVEGAKAADVTTAGVGLDNIVPIATAAIFYDDGTYTAIAEYASVSPEDGLLPAEDKAYILFGRYFGRWFPFLGWSTLETSDDTNDIAARITALGTVEEFLSAHESKSQSFGIRYNATKGTSVTFEYNHFTSFEDTSGPFIKALSDISGESLNLMSVSFDAVF